MRPHKLFCLSILFCFLNLMTLAARATDAKICLWQIKHRRVQTAAVGLCRGVYVFIGRVELCPSSGLCSGVCRQPQWSYVGVFMYSLAGWAYSFQRFMLRRGLTAAVGLCRGVYIFIGRVAPVIRHALSCGLCTGVG